MYSLPKFFLIHSLNIETCWCKCRYYNFESFPTFYLFNTVQEIHISDGVTSWWNLCTHAYVLVKDPFPSDFTVIFCSDERVINSFLSVDEYYTVWFLS